MKATGMVTRACGIFGAIAGRTGSLAVGTVLAIALPSVNGAAAQTLEDTLVRAYVDNPTLRAQRAGLRATDEGVAAARAGYRPTVGLSGSGSKTASLRAAGAAGAGAGGSRSTSFDLVVSQPVFRGLRTISSTREAERLVRTGRAQLKSAEQLVLLQAVTVYMNVVRDQAVLDLTVNNERVLARQLEAARARFKTRDVTVTDVAQSRSRLARAKAARIAAEGNLTASRSAYQNVIGTAAGQLVNPEVKLELPASLEETIDRAVAQNPDLEAARFQAEAASQRIKVVRGELLPAISLIGRATRTRLYDGPDATSVTASVLATLTVPIYLSGSVQSRVRAAKQIHGQRRIDIERFRRQSIDDAIAASAALTSARAQIGAFQSQVEATRIALEGAKGEAISGERTVLDVLDAEQEFLNAQVNLVGARRDEIVAQYRLVASIGRLTARDLALPVDYYDETEHYERVRGKWFGLGPG